MVLKREIVAELGGADLLAPEAIAQSLVANDEVKYYLALLQTARSNADHPRVPPPDLKTERMASRLEDASLDDVVAGTEKSAGGRYRVPRSADIVRRVDAAISSSWTPIAQSTGFRPRPRPRLLRARMCTVCRRARGRW
jgi:hypothetical protein